MLPESCTDHTYEKPTTKNARIVVTTVDGKTWTSDSMEMDDELIEGAEEQFKRIGELSFLTIHSRGTRTHLNPRNIVSFAVESD